MNKRPQQLESVIRETIQKVVDRGLQDPRVSGMVTITGVKVSEDLREASVLVSVMPEEAEKLTLHGLTHAAGFLRKKLGEVVQGRHLPQLHFKIDHQIKKQAAVIDALAKVNAEREALAASGGQPAKDAASPQAQDAPSGGGWLKRPKTDADHQKERGT